MTDLVAAEAGRATTWQRTSPVAIVFFFGKVLRMLLDAGWPALVGIWGAIQAGKASWIIWAVSSLLALLAVFAVLSWWRFFYRLSDDKVLLRRGVLHREQLTIDFARVQNVRVLEPFYARPFGLALLEIDTAGSAGKEVTLGGIDANLARALRDTIVSEQRQVEAEQEQEQTTDQGNQQQQELLRRNARDITVYGLTHNGLFWVAVVLGAFFSQWDSDSWFSPERVARLVNLQLWDAWQIALLVIGLFMLLPFLSIAGSFWRYHGYVLTREGKTYRRHSGLVSKHDESVKRHKIQSAVWKQNFVARLLGRINLKLRQAKAGAVEHQPNNRKQPFIVPALRPVEAASLTAELIPGAAVLEVPLSRVHRREYIKKNLLFGWTLPLAGAHTGLVFSVGWWTLFLLPLTIALASLILWQCWRKLGYAINGTCGLVRTGFIGTQTTVFELYKAQRVDIRQSPSQRRRGLAHLTIHLASHSMTVPYLTLADAERYRDLALLYTESSRRRWV